MNQCVQRIQIVCAAAAVKNDKKNRTSGNHRIKPMSQQSIFQEVPAIISFPEEEEKILQFWNEIDAFKNSLKKSEGRKPYSFYDGPPFATGLPHYGHILAGAIKVCLQQTHTYV